VALRGARGGAGALQGENSCWEHQYVAT
jgi:hypothetical protein